MEKDKIFGIDAGWFWSTLGGISLVAYLWGVSKLDTFLFRLFSAAMVVFVVSYASGWLWQKSAPLRSRLRFQRRLRRLRAARPGVELLTPLVEPTKQPVQLEGLPEPERLPRPVFWAATIAIFTAAFIMAARDARPKV